MRGLARRAVDRHELVEQHHQPHRRRDSAIPIASTSRAILSIAFAVRKRVPL